MVERPRQRHGHAHHAVEIGQLRSHRADSARMPAMGDDALSVNRAMWDELAALHGQDGVYDLEGFLAGGDTLSEPELSLAGDVSAARLLHLQCHFGMDTLSWARRGARVTGADFSERAIEQARRLAAETGLDATFVVADVIDLPARLDGDFDVVFTSFGVLNWLPDVPRWAEVVAHFVRSGGFFYIAEAHPFAWVFDDDAATDLRLHYHYWPSPEPLVFPNDGSYADPAVPVEEPFEYAWQHSMGEIISSLAAAGLRIDYLHEHPWVPWKMFPFMVETEEGVWRLPEPDDQKLPLLFSLRATKP
jgi:SAM-dependent methyltransferase